MIVCRASFDHVCGRLFRLTNGRLGVTSTGMLPTFEGCALGKELGYVLASSIACRLIAWPCSRRFQGSEGDSFLGLESSSGAVLGRLLSLNRDLFSC